MAKQRSTQVVDMSIWIETGTKEEDTACSYSMYKMSSKRNLQKTKQKKKHDVFFSDDVLKSPALQACPAFKK